MKELIEQAIEMIRDRPKEEVEFIHYILTMEEDLKIAFLLAYNITKDNESIAKAVRCKTNGTGKPS